MKNAIRYMLNASLSIEAKSLVSKEYYENKLINISNVISSLGLFSFDPSKVVNILEICFGEVIKNNIYILDERTAGGEPVIQTKASKNDFLIYLRFYLYKNEQKCDLVINHGLADEFSLKTLSRYIFEMHMYHCDERIYSRLTKYRENYLEYISNQTKFVQVSRKKAKQSLYPEVEMCHVLPKGPLSYSSLRPLVVLEKAINKSELQRKNIYRKFIDFLQKSDALSVGEVFCSSLRWKLNGTDNVVGMMTGLIPIPVKSGKDNNLEKFDCCLEQKAIIDVSANYLLSECRKTDIFFNGAESKENVIRNVAKNNFPVGVDVIYRNKERLLTLEGRFESSVGVNSLLQKFDI